MALVNRSPHALEKLLTMPREEREEVIAEKCRQKRELVLDACRIMRETGSFPNPEETRDLFETLYFCLGVECAELWAKLMDCTRNPTEEWELNIRDYLEKWSDNPEAALGLIIPEQTNEERSA